MKFDIGPGVPCDLDTLIDSRLLVQANSGGGKSWCIRRILEQTFGKVQHLIIDPEGEFASLRERFDYVLAAKHGGDTAADPRSAKLLAQRLLELNASAILDIYELRAHERVRFVHAFLEALVDAPKALWHPALVVVDEAHVYCPQKGDAESASAVIDLATRGRKRGFCAVLATQRLSKLHKDAAAECNNKLIGRTGLDVDMKRASEELGFVGRDEQHQLRELGEGDFFAFGSALSKMVTRVHVGGVQTTHPKAGARIAFTAPPPTDRVLALLPQLSDLPAEAEAERKDNAALRQEVATLKRERTMASRGQQPPDEDVIERYVQQATAALGREHASVLKGAQARHVKLEQVVRTSADALTKLAERMCMSLNGAAPATPLPPVLRPEPAVAPVLPPRREPASDGRLARAERRILTILAQYPEGRSHRQVAVITGYAHRGGGFNNAIGALRSQSLLEGSKDSLSATPAGLDALGEWEPLPIGPELVAYWRGQLPRAERAILERLADVYPMSMPKVVLAEDTGYEVTGGGFNNALGKLRTLELITGSAELQMSEHLA